MKYSQNYIARWLTILACFIGVSLLGFIGFRYSLSTDYALSVVKSKIEKELKENFSADLVEIKSIYGDAWNSLMFEDIVIEVDGISLSIKNLATDYRLKDVIFGNLIVQSLVIEGMQGTIDFGRIPNQRVSAHTPESEKEVISISMNHIRIADGNFEIKSTSYFPDSLISINDLVFKGNGRFGNANSIGIEHVNFQINHDRLPEAISLGMDAEITKDSISLNDVVFALGDAALKGGFKVDEHLNNVSGIVAAKDVKLQNLIPEFSTNLDISTLELKLEGTLHEFEVTLSANGPTLQNLKMKTVIIWEKTPIIRSINLSADYINSTNIFDSIQVLGGPIRMNVSGNSLMVGPNSSFDWSIETSNFKLNALNFERLNAKGKLENNSLIGDINLEGSFDETLNSKLRVDSLFSAKPVWNVDYSIQKLKPHTLDKRFLKGEINAEGTIHGHSFSFAASEFDFTVKSLRTNTGKPQPWYLGDDRIDEIELHGSVNPQKIITEGYLRVLESELNINANFFNPFDVHLEYTYLADFRNLNIGDFSLFKESTSQLTGKIQGVGKGRFLNTANQLASLSLEPGHINNAAIDSLHTRIEYEQERFIIRDGVLLSEIADGVIFGKQNVIDSIHSENKLYLNINVKNLQPLAAFFGLNTLQATGQVDGSIEPNTEKLLNGKFELNLSDVLIDSVFEADHIAGTSNIEIETHSKFNAKLDINNPMLGGVALQDITMNTSGMLSEDSLQSAFELAINGNNNHRLLQKGTIAKHIPKGVATIQFTRFDFLSPASNLVLQKPFNIWISESEYSTDTLSLTSYIGASLDFIIPYSREKEAKVFFSGNEVDIGLFQHIVFGKKIVDGALSGDVHYHLTPGDVVSNGLVRIDQLLYKGAEADSVIFGFDIINERLNTRANIYWDSTLAVTGWVDVPFVIEKSELDDEFYHRPVKGGIHIQPTDVTKFESWLDELGISSTTGMVSFQGKMSGKAGTPEFTGELEIEHPKLSGVSVDQILAEFNYSNPNKRLMIQSEIYDQSVPILELNIAYPVHYDFRNFELKLPAKDDELEISAVSNNLNIAFFNDFVNPNYISSMEGNLTVDLYLKGALGKIRPKGGFILKNARLQLPYSQTTFENIALEIEVDPSALNIPTLYAESGRGSLNLLGKADLMGLKPTNFLFDVYANQFEFVNNRNTYLEIDLEATLSGEMENPHLIGDLKVGRGFYLLDNFGDHALEKVYLEDENINSFAVFDSLTMDVVVKLDKDFFIRNSDYLDIEVQPSGLLDLQKERGDGVKLIGELTVNKGYVRPLGKPFEVKKGNINFTGPFMNPDLKITSAYIPKTRQKGESVELYYMIKGTHLDPIFTFKSAPNMEQSDVICFTLFNKPCYSLEAWRTVFAEKNDVESFQVLSDLLLDEVETIATQELGVDVVQIDNSGQSGRTAITTGWYLNERTFFSIINELTNSTPKTLFVLEYLLNENWDLIITQGEDSRKGIDVQYQYDY